MNGWLALTCTLLPLSAQAASQDPWLAVKSANFELYTTGSERSARDLVRHFEQVRSFFVQAFGGRLSAARPARIIAFRSEKEYQPYRPNDFAAAFYQPGSTHDFIVMSSPARENYPVATHEFTHLMIHQSGMQLPAWLNEGLAELYSSLEPRGNKILVGEPLPGRVRVLNSSPWIPLETLLTVDHNSPYYNERSRAGMFYAESWALVHMLNLEPEFRSRLNALAGALKEVPPDAAFARTYGKRIDDLEAALHTYFNAATVHAELFNVQLPKSVEAPEIETAAALPARLALAELLNQMRGRGQQARDALELLAKEFPSRWEVEAGAGEFAWEQRNLQDAARHLARAVELGCNDESHLLLYARVLTYARRDKEAAAVMLTAAKLYPDSNDVNLELGAALVRTGNYGAALAALVSVKKVASAAQAYRLYYNLAYAQYRVSDVPHAGESLAKARTYTSSPSDIAALDRLQQAVDRHWEEAPTAVSYPAVEGTLENMECGAVARLHVRIDGEIKVFLIPDPTRNPILKAGAKAINLECGAQKPQRPVRIEYQEMPSGAGAALVRTLEFK
jgi:hypothetical protein